MKCLISFFIFSTLVIGEAIGQSAGTSWPADSRIVSSPFGPRLKASSDFSFDWHRGIDIAGNLGEGIYAISDGIVDGVFAAGSSQFPNGGNVVRIKHQSQQTFYSLYLHLNEIAVSEGQAVVSGQPIGTMGETGDTEFVHLHFEIRERTPCSLEAQLQDGACGTSATGQDPHVNPMGYLLPPNDVAPSLRVTNLNPLTALVTGPAQELDFNRLEIKLDNGEQVTLDLNRRVGFDASTNANLDRSPTADGVTIRPKAFSASSFIENQPYQIEFVVEGVKGFRSVTAVDLWGNQSLEFNDDILDLLPAILSGVKRRR